MAQHAKIEPARKRKKAPIHKRFRRYDPSKSPTRFPEDPKKLTFSHITSWTNDVSRRTANRSVLRYPSELTDGERATVSPTVTPSPRPHSWSASMAVASSPTAYDSNSLDLLIADAGMFAVISSTRSR